MTKSKNKQEARLVETNWQHFIASVLCSALFPLAPLAIEFFLSGSISDNSILISAVMYCSAIALTSESVLIFVLGFLVSIVFAMLFGITFYNDLHAPDGSHAVSLIAIAFFCAAQMMQGYNRHVVRAEDFISFAKAGD
jgi:hypothetical protein